MLDNKNGLETKNFIWGDKMSIEDFEKKSSQLCIGCQEYPCSKDGYDKCLLFWLEEKKIESKKEDATASSPILTLKSVIFL